MVSLKKAGHVTLYLALVVGLVASSQALVSSPTLEDAKHSTAAVKENTAFTRKAREAALQQLEEAARAFVEANEMAEAARILYRVGSLQLLLNDLKAAIASHTKALKLLKGASSNETKVDNLNGLAAAYLRSQRLVDAGPVLRRSLYFSELSGYAAGKAQALLTLSDLQNYEDHSVALHTAQQALILWQALDDKFGLAHTYNQIGQCYLAQNLLSEATQNYQTALQLARDMDDKPGQAGALIALGSIEYRKGSWQDSINYHLRAEELVEEKAEPKRMGQVAVGLAEAFNESGLPETGLVHFLRALEYYRQTQDPTFVAYAMWGLGCTYYLLGNYTEATRQFNLALAEVPADSLQAAQCHEQLGKVYLSVQEHAIALEHLQRALAIYTRSINPKEAAQTQGLMAETYLQQGRIGLARKYYQRSFVTFVKLSDRLNQAAILYGLGRLELGASNYDVAESYLSRSINVTENIHRVSTSTDLTAAFSASVYDRYRSYIECLMRKHARQPDRGFAIQALETNELARARSLGEMLRSTATGFAPGVDPQLVAQEKSLRQSLRVKEDSKVRLLAGNYKRDELTLLEADLARLENDYKQVNENIRARYPAFEQLTRPAAWNLKQGQEQVIADDQTVLLEYSLGPNKSYVWVVTRDGLASYELPSQKVITDAVMKVYTLLSTQPGAGTGDQLELAAHELSRIILLPVASHLNKQRIIVVADGALNYIPFQFLPAPSESRDQLVASHEIINAPSAAVEGQLRQETTRRQPRANVLAAFGDPVFQSNFSEQPDRETDERVAGNTTTKNAPSTVRDVELTGDSFDPATIEPVFYSGPELANLREVAGEKTLLATRFEATTEKLRQTDLTKFSILHLATHGLLDPDRPEKSGLLLSTLDRKGQAQNGFVGLQDIYSLHAPVDLVVLSACRTGLGKDVRGEGLIGLTRGFIYAGASSVVASLWRVDDRATSELMKRFYTNMLKHGMKPSEALRAAQNSIRQEPQWRAPYYWAAFTIQGDYRQSILLPAPAESKTRQKVIVGLVASLILLSGAAWYFVRRRTRHSIAN